MSDDDTSKDDSEQPNAYPLQEAQAAQTQTETQTPTPDSIGITIQALRGSHFTAGFRGYKRTEVDAFLDRIAQALENVREQADKQSNEVREITEFARRAMEGEIERGKDEAARVVAEAEERRREADAERNSLAEERKRLADDTERSQKEIKTELERARNATVAAEQARDDVEAERQRLADTRQTLESEREELARLRDQARAAESRSHELRRQLLAETERAISDRWTELGEHLNSAGKQQAARLLELVSDFIQQIDPALLTSFIPPPSLTPEPRPGRLSALPYRDPESS